MPREKCVTLYQFDELPEGAKDRAREWYRSGWDDPDWAEFVIDDFVKICGLLGVEIDTRSVPLMNGKTHAKPMVYYSGFSSQGDGASFTGQYAYAKGSQAAIRAYAPGDIELHQIADTLAAIQKPYQYDLGACISRQSSHHYVHEYTVRVDVDPPERWSQARIDRDEDWKGTEDGITTAMRDLMRWLYRTLEKEYDFQQSNEVVDENIRCNEYEFTEDGARA